MPNPLTTPASNTPSDQIWQRVTRYSPRQTETEKTHILLGEGREEKLQYANFPASDFRLRLIDLAAPGDSLEIQNPIANESVFLLSGKVSIVSEEPGNGKPMRQDLEKFDAFVVPPGTKNTLTNAGDGRARLMGVRYGLRDPYVKTGSVGRFRKQKPMRKQPVMRLIPDALQSVLSPHTLYLMVGPKRGRKGVKYATLGPDQLHIALAGTPPQNGPALHIHERTDEIFVVLEGSYKIQWGDKGEHEVLLNQFDAIAIPPGINRRFENAGTTDGWLMPIVIGANNELRDLVWLPAIEKELREKVPALFMTVAKWVGVRFRERKR